MTDDRRVFIVNTIVIYHHCLPDNSVVPKSLAGYISYVYDVTEPPQFLFCHVCGSLSVAQPPGTATWDSVIDMTMLPKYSSSVFSYQLQRYDL